MQRLFTNQQQPDVSHNTGQILADVRPFLFGPVQRRLGDTRLMFGPGQHTTPDVFLFKTKLNNKTKKANFEIKTMPIKMSIDHTHIVRRDELDQSVLGQIEKGGRPDAFGRIFANERDASLQKRSGTMHS